VRDNLQGLTNAKLFNTGMSLRSEFWRAKKWDYPQNNDYHFYCSAAGPAPYKSIQTAIKALSVVVKKYPQAKLHIIGNFNNSCNWLHRLGYLTYLYKLINKLGLNDSVIFDGALTADEIIKLALNCLGMVQTSYVESYSLAVVEAQALGIPSIVSYAGAMPELAVDIDSALFFPPGDYMSCAGKMIILIENKNLALKLSSNSYNLARIRNNDDKVLNTQLYIYNKILNNDE
jgi:glycosyltransferase involved in cell wall biosynthesis